MDCTFIETVDDPDEEKAIGAANATLRQAASAAQAAMELAEIDYPDGTRYDDLLDAINQIESALFSFKLTVEGVVNQVQGIVGDLIDDVQKIQDHSKWAAEFLLIDLWNKLGEVAERAGAQTARPVGIKSFDVDKSIDVIANEVSNTVGEVMTLNTSLLGSQTVPAGTPVQFYLE